MTKFFVFCFAIAAAFAIGKYVLRVEGTRSEKLAFLMKVSKQLIFGIKAKYAARHRFNKRLPVRYGFSS